jgi:hypothetical protein
MLKTLSRVVTCAMALLGIEPHEQSICLHRVLLLERRLCLKRICMKTLAASLPCETPFFIDYLSIDTNYAIEVVSKDVKSYLAPKS